MNERRHRTSFLAAKTAPAAVVCAAMALVSGCEAMNSMASGVWNPISPEQSKAQVVDAAKEVVNILKLPATDASFSRASCNDQGEAPFRGKVAIGYPRAPSFETSDAAVADMIRLLQGHGWNANRGALSHGTVLTKNGVDVTFYPQNSATVSNLISIVGECRDTTTTKAQAGVSEDLSLD